MAWAQPCEKALEIFHAVPPVGTTHDPAFSEFAAATEKGQTLVILSTPNAAWASARNREDIRVYFETPESLATLPSQTVDGIFVDRAFRKLTPEQTVAAIKHCYHALRAKGRLFMVLDTPQQNVFSPKHFLHYRSAVDARHAFPGFFADLGLHTFEPRTVHRILLDNAFEIQSVDWSSYPDRPRELRDLGGDMDAVVAKAFKN